MWPKFFKYLSPPAAALHKHSLKGAALKGRQGVYVHFSWDRFYTQHLLHLQDVIYTHNRINIFNSEIFVDHYPCILLPRIIIILFLPAYPHQTSSDSLDLNKLQVLHSIFRYYLFLWHKHPKVSARISAPAVLGFHKRVHIDIPCPGGYLSAPVSTTAI